MSFFDKLTDGLRLYEVVLLLLGAIMFLALVIILIIYTSQRRQIKPLLVFFAVPVLMLVWPSIQKIKVNGEGAEIEKLVDNVKDNPSEENKEKLQASLQTLEDRNVKDPEVVRQLAIGHYLLGQNKEAIESINLLPEGNFTDPEMKNIQTSINVTTQLKDKLVKAQTHPDDSVNIKEINRLQQVVEKLPVKSEETQKTIIRAQDKVADYRRVHPGSYIARPLNQ